MIYYCLCRIVSKPLIVDFLTTANEGLLRKPVGNKCRIVGSSKLDSLKMNKKIYDNKRPFRVSIEGNIGAGKSSVINYLATFPGVEVYDVCNTGFETNGGDNVFFFYVDNE